MFYEEWGRVKVGRVVWAALMVVVGLMSPLVVRADDAATMRDTIHDRLSMDISMVQRLHVLTDDMTATREEVFAEAQLLAKWLDDSLFLYSNAAAIGDREWLRLANVAIGDLSRYRYALDMYLNALRAWSVTQEDAAISALNTEWLAFQRDYDALRRRNDLLQGDGDAPAWFTISFWSVVALGIVWVVLRRRRRKRESMRPPRVQPVFRPRAEIIDVYDPNGTTPAEGERW